jgi:hypothetical protein
MRTSIVLYNGSEFSLRDLAQEYKHPPTNAIKMLERLEKVTTVLKYIIPNIATGSLVQGSNHATLFLNTCRLLHQLL